MTVAPTATSTGPTLCHAPGRQDTVRSTVKDLSELVREAVDQLLAKKPQTANSPARAKRRK